MVGKILGHYEILEPLGQGGMGEVYRARDTKLDRDVAIKVLPEDFAKDADRLARFTREAKLLAQLNHPNIAGVYGLEDEGDTRFIAMELVVGETLADRIAQSGRIDVDEALEIARQIAEALEAAHENGVVHRDLKPANIIVAESGKAKVLDFGLAKAFVSDGGDGGDSLTHSPTATVGATEAGILLGTAPYMSPEQAKGKVLDKRTDIWAFGCVMFEMLTGKRPFQGENVTETLAAVLKEDPTWDLLPADTPPLGASLLRRCLRKDPNHRLRDIGDARIEIEDLMSSAPVVPTVTERTLLSGPWIALGMSVGALALVATTVAVWPEPSFPPSEIVTLTFDGGLKQHPKLSPDGARVAFDWGGPEGDNRDIYVKTVGPDTFAQRLTTHPAEELGAGWSPDGSRLAFFRVANERAAIHLIPASGGDAEKLVDMEGPYRPLDRPRPGPLSWSPDGRYLVTAQRASATAPARVVVVDIETRQIRAITDPEAAGATIGDIGPSFSPDGRWIAFARGEARHGSYDVWVIDASGEQPERRVTSRRWLVFHDLSWHPNGQEILLSAGTHSIVRSFRVDIGEGVPLLVGGGLGDNNNSLHAVAGRLVYRRWVPANWGLWVGPGRLADDPDAEPRLFLDTFAFEGHQAHSPDSSQIAFRSDRTGQAQIWVANRDGSNPRQLTFLETGADVPTWGPNGLIVFGTQEAGNNDIWTVDVETRVVRPVTSYEGLDDFPVFSPDGQYIYFSSDRSSAMQIHRIPVGGGPPVDQITRQGGDVPIVWGDYVYYATSTGNVSIWRVPLEGGEEAEVLAGPIFSVNWGIAGDGLYYHARGGVHRHDLVTGETMQLFSGGGLWHSVSPDEKDVMFRRGTPQSAELFVLENFR